MCQIENVVQSPCRENCCLNDENICVGCFRSLAEIAQWQQMDNRTRLDVLRRAENRRKVHDDLGAKNKY
jgi:predicted Fe-S protein YdhL (DUF1289 family)